MREGDALMADETVTGNEQGEIIDAVFQQKVEQRIQPNAKQRVPSADDQVPGRLP
jgi:hypothetical protein